MQNSKDIQELIYRTIENISKELINKTNYLYLVEGKVTEIDTLGNCYVFKYQDEDYVGFSITGEKYKIGDLIYVLFSNNKDVKKMILSKTKAFSNNDIRRLVMRAQSSADKAKESAQEALNRVQEIGQDGNISPNEKLMIKKDWENIKIEYAQVIEEMELYGGSENKILKPLKEQYNNNYIALKSYIEPILEDLTSSFKIESAEFLEKFNNYYSVRQGIAQAIADITKTMADKTQELAKINEKLLADIANDDKLTPSEKQSILKEFQGIIAEYKVIIEQAKYYGLIYTNYDNSYNELLAYLNPLLEDLNSTSDIIGTIFRQYFINYYTERQKLQKSISDKAKDIAGEAENIANEALENTKLLSIEADGQIFSKTSDSEDFYPNYISLSVKTNVVTFDKFQYKTSNTDWQDVVSEEHGFTIIGEILTISKDSDLFTNSNNNITIQALSSDPSIKDIFTIVKVQDGVIGENALSVILTNEAHVFPAGVSAALNSSTETEILAFDGASPTEVEVVSISTLPSGLTAQISNNNTLKPKITFTATTLLTEVKDVIITIRVKNTEIQRYFSYTLGLKGEPGEPGENAWTIVLGNDSQNIPCNSNGITNTSLTIDIPVYTFYGTLMVDSILSVGTLPSGVIATSITNGTTSAPGNVQLTFSNNINLGGKDSGTIDININASNKNFIKKFSWSKTKQGEEGIPGEEGKGISKIEVFYLTTSASSGVTTSTSGWSTTPTATTTTDKYIWSYQKTTYTDSSTSLSTPAIIGTHGATGAQGIQGPPGSNGISSYTHIAYANSSDGKTDFSISDSNREYIGICVDSNPTDTTNPDDYLWSKIKGADGADGLPGKTGSDGKTAYLHIAYANNETGTSGFSTTDSTNKLYIGQYTDFTLADSTDPSKYSWTKIKGETGATGNGIKLITYYYTRTTSQTPPNASDITSTSMPSLDNTNKYLWQKEVITYTDNTTKINITLLAVYGDKGDSGRVYFLEPSSLVIKKGSDNVLNPSNITFQSYYRDGTSAIRIAYSGRFIIQESIDGDNYTTKYTSSADESSKTYTPSSSNIKSIKCILYAAGGTTTQLDSQTVVVLTDIDNIEIGGRNYALNTSSDWSDWFIPTADVADSYNVFSFANMPDTLKIGDTYTLSIELEWSKFTTSTIKAMTTMLQLIPYVYENNNAIILNGKLNNGVLELDGNVEYSNGILTVKDNNFISDWVYNTNYINLYDLTDMMLKGNNTIRIEKQITFETKEQTDITKYGIAIRCNYSNGTGKIRARKIKLEIGNKATDWSSAPEDIKESISNSKQEAIEISNAYIDKKEKEIISTVENVKTVVDNHTTAISVVQSSIQQTQNKVDTVFTQTEEIRNLTDENSSQLQQYKQYISMEPVKHEGETEPRPTITLGQSTSSFKVAIDNKEIAFTGASGEKVAYITGDELRINNVVVVKKLAIGDFYLEQEQNNHLVLKKGG